VGSFEAKEDAKGLFINGGFFLDQDGGVKAYKLVKKFFDTGIKVGLSMGYQTVKDLIEKVEGGIIRHLKEVRLKEGSITLFPMDKQAGLTQLKEEDGSTEPDSDRKNEELLRASEKKTLSNKEPSLVDRILEEFKKTTPEEKPSKSEVNTKRLTKILTED